MRCAAEHASALRRQCRGRRETSSPNAQSAAGRTHRRDRGGRRRAHLRLARRRRQPGDGVRARGRPQAALSATPARRRCSRRSRPTKPCSTAISTRWSRPARTRASTFHYGIDAAGNARAARRLRPHRGRDRVHAIRFGLGRLPAWLLDRGAGRWPCLRQILLARDFATGFTTGRGMPAGSDCRRLARAGSEAHRDRRCGKARQGEAGDRQRVRSRATVMSNRRVGKSTCAIYGSLAKSGAGDDERQRIALATPFCPGSASAQQRISLITAAVIAALPWRRTADRRRCGGASGRHRGVPRRSDKRLSALQPRRHASLKRRNLTGANLAGANLAGASFHRAVLRGANFSGADLTAPISTRPT